MSPEWFVAAEQMLIRECKSINVIITTAQIPGRKVPILIKRSHRNCGIYIDFVYTILYMLKLTNYQPHFKFSNFAQGCVGGISCLSSQNTARLGVSVGICGIGRTGMFLCMSKLCLCICFPFSDIYDAFAHFIIHVLLDLMQLSYIGILHALHGRQWGLSA